MQCAAPRQVSRTKTPAFVPLANRLVAADSNATNRPVSSIRGAPLGPFDASPNALTDTSVNAPNLDPAGTDAPPVILNATGADVPPPGAGVETVTFAEPAVAMSLAKIDAVNCVALPNVVVRGLPFQFTLELLTKLVPVTISENAIPPAAPEDGFKPEIAGTGLSGASMKNVRLFDVPPPGVGVNTVIYADPGAAMSVARICATSWPVLGSGVVVRGLPFQFTTELFSMLSATTFS